ncbi:Asp-tRNA(Asn)/Glu-tRNA(Gln) amidotransferase subunit GatA [Flavihumibacter rivuli]|uniref:Asp-tRNA(Asn)/Glu-tRNA(Gln) amidotransferase subunit GatA n=1 Tax=Flavihumibacter rivuli TaxID=2838156 RepID=UPI001BDF2BF0|nr:Asp-tRNA(Asn)/Glu-tRNA(Gln) amidotransferase subunit GatA [Flavihumibacter rivuli]ULQ56446.1 Asp-tRNA(Asn)/Glu-tRNA(Gln) amidotransferase subunit GatA [Flavihumibacter rivuli]
MFSFESIAQYHNELKKGSTTCSAVVEFYLLEIESKRHLNAFVEVYRQEAVERAAELDARRKDGSPLEPLHGVVVGIKDVLCYKGHKVTASSRMLANYTASYNATAITKLLEAGAIIIGSLNCDEFAMGSSNENSYYGPTLNAHDNTRVPGGSSGGSAVAVQANLCMVSLGSDTGGSVRQPADFCGIMGLKPSYGRVSRYGLIAYASSFDQIGIFGKNIPDISRTLSVIAGPDQYDSTVSQLPVPDYASGLQNGPNKWKFAYFRDAVEHPSLDPVIKESLLNYFDRLRSAGHTVDALEFPLLEYIVPTYYILTTAEASSNLGRFDGVRYGHRTELETGDLTDFYARNRSEGFGREVKRRIMLGSFVLSAGYYDAYFTKAQQVRRQLYDQTQLIFKDYDVILSPTAPTTAFSFGEKSDDPVAMYLGDIYTVFANLAGIPGISLPLFWHNNGMPFGLQAMTNQFQELSLLQVSELLVQHAH